MEKNIVISRKQVKQVKVEQKSVADRLAGTSVIMSMAELFSIVMEEKVSAKMTLFVLNAMAAGFMVVFPVDMPVLARIIAVVWFGMALLQCKWCKE